jgi:hypothetical protein
VCVRVRVVCVCAYTFNIFSKKFSLQSIYTVNGQGH